MRNALSLALALPLFLLANACTYDNGHVHRVDSSPNYDGGNGTGTNPAACSSSTTLVQSKIDVGAKIDIDVGKGAGVFIEYASGGHWQVRTSCDTLTSKTNCAWDIIVTPEDGSAISNAAGSDLESDDVLEPYSDNVSYHLLATTGNDLDGFTFDSDPGSAVRVDAYLDQQCAVPYFYWVGDGALHSGSPTNPLDLIPSAD